MKSKFMTKEEVFNKRLYRKAFDLIRTVKQVAIQINHFTYTKTGIQLEIQDMKLLTKWLSPTSFYVNITKDFFEEPTIQTDLVGKIPSDLDLENKIILRIAHLIWVNFNTNILAAYKIEMKKDWPAPTHYNAKKWYNNL